MAKKVTTIPAIPKKISAQPISGNAKRRVAGYARVSTDKEEQQSSYAAQMEYYTTYIQSRCDWEFAGMYADEGITATNTKHRDGFNQMVADALDGKIDLIITKSISRFARNTVDSLTTIRKLKEKGVEIFFEKESIWTLDAKGELLITIMSSLAQEESRSISENTTWGKRKLFSKGKTWMGYSRFLGYDLDFKINEEQAKTVRLIYKLYLSGLSCYAISHKLEELGIKPPAGGKRWYLDSVKSILTNEKYMGDALIQKTYTVDFLTKKKVKNNGEVPQYYVEDHHEGIIDAQTFRLVQAEMERRFTARSTSVGSEIFSAKIVCSECGRFFGSRIWHSNDKYRKIIWQCSHKYRKDYKTKCNTPSLSEDEIKALFLKAINAIEEDREEVLANAETLKALAADTSALEAERDTIASEMQFLQQEMKETIAENARREQHQDHYTKKYDALAKVYEEERARYNAIPTEITAAKASAAKIESFIKTLRESDIAVPEFQEELWSGLLESMKPFSKTKAEFTFRGGFKVTVA